MPIDPNAIGAKTDPHVFEWTDRDTLLYALGVGAGTDDLAFTTENSPDIPQQVLPTYAVIACTGFAAAGKIGTFNFARLLHGSQEIRLYQPLPPAGRLSVVGEVADIQDKGEGKNAVVMVKATGTDPDTGAPALVPVKIRDPKTGKKRPLEPADVRIADLSRLDQELLVRFLTGDERVVFGGQPISGVARKE